jgi:protein-disulfide isomerase
MKALDCFKLIVLTTLILFSLNVVAENTINDKKTNILGNLNAPNILIEYASLSCVHCANFHNKKLPEIEEKLIKTGKLQYIYKDFPLDMPAMLASMVTNCYEGEQFHTTLSSLFRNQKKWVTASSNKEELFSAFYQILKQHGISLEKIKTCAAENEENKKKWDSILASRLEGQKLGVNSTPSFILNGKKLEGSVDLKVLLKHIY